MNKTQIIAEVGCNHKGDMQIAKELISIAAAFAKVDVVKFQKRNVRELLTEDEYKAKHPNPMHSYGETYGQHREFLEFNLDQHKQLQDWCKEFGVEYSTSVWDVTSAKEISQLKPSLIKVPSACNLNRRLLLELIDNYEGEIHVSLGMTTREEQEKIVNLFVEKGRNKDLVLYSCTSGYPVEFKDVCLLEIVKLKNDFGSVVKGIGFSGHHLGIAVDIAALTLGVRYVERHFTLDRTWKGTDHAASLEPDGLRRLTRDIRNVGLSLQSKQSDILEVESIQREKLKKNQIHWL